MTLKSIIGTVEGRERTLTAYDPADPTTLDAIERYFEVQRVSVETATAPDGPSNFAVLHDGDRFLAAAALDDLRAAVSFETGLLDATDFRETRLPDILTHVDDTTFTSYDKRRMLLASREIEERAWRAGAGDLHAGFQRLSLLADQWDLYDRLVDSGLDVHVYGAPDWAPPETERLTVHASDAGEIRDSWFVAFESPGNGDCALLAEERDPNDYAGFWSYDEAIVGDVLARLRDAYP